MAERLPKIVKKGVEAVAVTGAIIGIGAIDKALLENAQNAQRIYDNNPHVQLYQRYGGDSSFIPTYGDFDGENPGDVCATATYIAKDLPGIIRNIQTATSLYPKTQIVRFTTPLFQAQKQIATVYNTCTYQGKKLPYGTETYEEVGRKLAEPFNAIEETNVSMQDYDAMRQEQEAELIPPQLQTEKDNAWTSLLLFGISNVVIAGLYTSIKDFDNS